MPDQTCIPEFERMLSALLIDGAQSPNYEAALYDWRRCRSGQSSDRGSNLADWDDRLYQLQQEIKRRREELSSKIQIPPKPCPEIFANKKNAMIYSEKINEAFEMTGNKLDDDETYACFVCVIKKPNYISEALAIDPLRLKFKGGSPANYILEPVIMEQVMNKIQQDTINYEFKNENK